jgi:hypothetical protein
MDPNRSWHAFKRGFSLFLLGALLILAGAAYAPLIQIPGLLLLAVGILYSAKGYLGLLANRMTASFKPPASGFDKDK